MQKCFLILVYQWSYISKKILTSKSLNWKIIVLSLYIFFIFRAVNCQMGFSDDDEEEIKVYYPKNSKFQKNKYIFF